MHRGQGQLQHRVRVRREHRLLRQSVTRVAEQPTNGVEYRTLRCGHNRNVPTFAALGPRGLEADAITLVGIGGNELDRFLPAQTKCPLQFQTEADVLIRDTRQRIVVERYGFGLIADELPVGYPVMLVTTRNDVTAIHFVRPPAKAIHAVFEGARGEVFRQPAFHQRLDVLRFEGIRSHAPVAQFVQLVGHLIEHPRPVDLRRITAVAIALTQLFELIVQISHRVRSLW